MNPFTDKQIELVTTFADQAVIAIENARLFDEVQARTRELSDALQQQTSTAEVLKVISRSAFDLQAVFDTLISSAVELIGAANGVVSVRDGDVFRYRAQCGSAPELMAYLAEHPARPGRGSSAGRVILSGKVEVVADVLEDRDYIVPVNRIDGTRSVLAVPMLRDDAVEGVFSIGRREPGTFTQRQIELLQTFADQAVIAVENARLFGEVQERTRDLSEALQQQTATADVLKIISRSAFDLQAVFDTLINSAVELIGGANGTICLRDGEVFRYRAHSNMAPELVAYLDMHPATPGRGSSVGRVLLSGKVECLPDLLDDADYVVPTHLYNRTRSILAAPLLRNDAVEGVLVITRTQPGEFTQRQIDIVQTFADQAVIAIENVRLFDEVQAKTRDLSEALQQQTATANVLKVISRSAFDLQAVFDTLIKSAVELIGAARGWMCLRDGDIFRYRAHSGLAPELVAYFDAHPARPERGSSAGRVILSGKVEAIPDVLKEDEYVVPVHRFDGTRSVLAVPMLRNETVEGVFSVGRNEPGTFTERHIELMQTFADQAVIAIENARLFDEVQARTRELTQSLDDLRTAQDRLIQTEKLASLGQLTAGIAHEIKNPLNFINNFADLSRELLGELEELVDGSTVGIDEAARAEIGELTGMLKSNLEKVAQHGRRADSIVKNMLLHSREGGGERRNVDLNAVVEEALNLAYHGARAEKPGFNITLAKTLDPAVGSVELFPQEFTRVLLNLIANGFHAAHRKKANSDAGFEPALTVSTKALPARVEIRIRDNGTGIPDAVKAKMFNPFFTTKPAGEGTGLGLSLSHEIIVKQHGGTLDVDTKVGEFTEFTVGLPRGGAVLPADRGGGRGPRIEEPGAL